MKISLDGLKRNLGLAEKERISEFEDTTIEMIKNKAHREKKAERSVTNSISEL